MTSTVPYIFDAGLTPRLKGLVDSAKSLYTEKLSWFVQDHHKPPAFVACAPGRVNLIGEHTDYTGGFVLPLAIDQSTVIYGTGFCHTGKGKGPTTIRIRLVSDKAPNPDIVEERRLTGSYKLPTEEDERSWVNYVIGVVVQYMPDLPTEGCLMDLALAISSDIPVGAGLSSSASLEVATAIFLEAFIHDMAFTSSPDQDKKVARALRCQKAENEWALSPCGIMDQMTSSCAEEGNLLFLDCRSYESVQVPMKRGGTEEDPVILIANSKAPHDIADSEYGLRRKQCHEAVEAMQEIPLYHVLDLRDANVKDLDEAKDKMEDVIYKRAHHVVTENQRAKETKVALKMGIWDRVGDLMNQSHKSLKEDFEVSTEELDFLVETAQNFDGAYGSRMTGGGFGGCTVTLVKKSAHAALIEHLQTEYKAKFNKECECFVTHPGAGARILAMDKDIKAESSFYS